MTHVTENFSTRQPDTGTRQGRGASTGSTAPPEREASVGVGLGTHGADVGLVAGCSWWPSSPQRPWGDTAPIISSEGDVGKSLDDTFPEVPDLSSVCLFRGLINSAHSHFHKWVTFQYVWGLQIPDIWEQGPGEHGCTQPWEPSWASLPVLGTSCATSSSASVGLGVLLCRWPPSPHGSLVAWGRADVSSAGTSALGQDLGGREGLARMLAAGRALRASRAWPLWPLCTRGARPPCLPGAWPCGGCSSDMGQPGMWPSVLWTWGCTVLFDFSAFLLALGCPSSAVPGPSLCHVVDSTTGRGSLWPPKARV